MTHYNEIDFAVATFLKGTVKFEAKLIREAMVNKSEEWKDTSDYFVCSFQSGSNFESFDFYTGVGLRINSKPKSLGNHAKYVIKRAETVEAGITSEYTMYMAKDVRINTTHLAATKQWITPPSPAIVLHSLLMDARVGEESFDDFCDNLGYDNDSVSALNVYQECSKTTKRIKKLFTTEQIKQLEELLQDY